MGPNMKYWDDWVDVEDMEAMWNHPEVCKEWILAGEERGMKVHMSRNFDGKPYVTQTEMKGMAEIITRRHFKRLDVGMICAIAEVESSRLPLAYRFEPKLGEASTGLMQTLQSTAEWLATDMGYRAYAIEGVSALLYRPFVSVYFGAAYLKWLSTYDGKKRDEEFIVRGYNGGPQGVTKTSTLAYWKKYTEAKQNLPNISEVPLIFVTPVPAPPRPPSPIIAPGPPPPPVATKFAKYQFTRSSTVQGTVGESTSIPSTSSTVQVAAGESRSTPSTSSSVPAAVEETKITKPIPSIVKPPVVQPKITKTPVVQPKVTKPPVSNVVEAKSTKLKPGGVREAVTQPKSRKPKPGSSANVQKEWTYWDEKVHPGDLDDMWRHPQVKKEWTASNEKKGHVRFARDAELRPYLTTTELKALAEITVSRYFGERVSPLMLRTIAEISSKRLLHGADGISGVMQTAYPTAAWLYKDMGYKSYTLRARDDLSNPFVAMYFGAAYVCWLTTYNGRHRTDEFVLRAYYAGPSGVEEPSAGIFYQKYLAHRHPPLAQELQKSTSTGGQWTTTSLWRGTDPAFQPPPNQSIWRRLWAAS